MDLYALYDTYDSALFERFRAAGVDPAGDHDLAFHLSEHIRNKPLFGFVKRHLGAYPAAQTELNLALGEHTREGKERGVMLCCGPGPILTPSFTSCTTGATTMSPRSRAQPWKMPPSRPTSRP